LRPWDLGQVRGFFDADKIEDDGTVAGMDTALEWSWIAIHTS
jgi:hypothetical protein